MEQESATFTSEQRHHTHHSASITTRRRLTREWEKLFPRRNELGRISQRVANEVKTRPGSSPPQYEAA